LTGPEPPDRTSEKSPGVVPDATLRAARAAAYRLLAGRDRSRRELTDRLALKHPKAAVAAVVQDLVRDGYLDDERLARHLAERWAAERNFGPRRVAHELARRGLAPLADLRPDPEAVQATAVRAARRCLAGTADVADPRTVRRLAGYLERRGFSGATIRAIVRRTRQGTLWSDP
jgi:regulatory protein